MEFGINSNCVTAKLIITLHLFLGDIVMTDRVI